MILQNVFCLALIVLAITATVFLAEKNSCPQTWTLEYGCEQVEITTGGIEHAKHN